MGDRKTFLTLFVIPMVFATYIQTCNGLFSGTIWVGQYHKDKPFWILLNQEMMGWQWHLLNHMQIICTSLQTDNHARLQHLITPYFLQAGCPSCHPTDSIKALMAKSTVTFCYLALNKCICKCQFRLCWIITTRNFVITYSFNAWYSF